MSLHEKKFADRARSVEANDLSIVIDGPTTNAREYVLAAKQTFFRNTRFMDTRLKGSENQVFFAN